MISGSSAKEIATYSSLNPIAIIALAWAAVASAPTKLVIAGVTLSSVLTLLTAIYLVFRALTIRPARNSGNPMSRSKIAMVPWPLSVFIALSVISTLFHLSQDAIQNLSCYLIFGLGIFVIGRASAPYEADRFLDLSAKWAGYIGVVGLVAQVLQVQLYDSRPFGLLALVLMGIVIPSKSKSTVVRIAPYVLAATVVLSLSRTASVIALILVIFVVARSEGRNRFLRVFFLTVLSGSALASLWFFYNPFSSRFLSGDNAITFNGTTFNTSGRASIWQALIDRIDESPILGHGTGSAAETVTQTFVFVTQPHNEYLRIVFDFGFVGLLFFILGMITLVSRLSNLLRRNSKPIHLASLIGLLAVLGASTTDNVLIYPFVMLPLGVLLGYSRATAIYNETQHDNPTTNLIGSRD